MASYKKVIEVLGIFELSFPKIEMKPGMARVWYELLKDIPDNVLETAAKQVAVENVFFPALSEVRSKCLDLTTGMDKLPTAGDAWEECHEKCIRNEYDNFSNPLIEKAYHQIGRQTWDTLLTDDVMATRAHFMKIYETLLSRAKTDIKQLPESRAMSERYQLGVDGLTKKLTMNGEDKL